MNKYKQLEERIINPNDSLDNIVFETVILANNYRKLLNNPDELRLFEENSLLRYKTKYNLLKKDVKYNINLVMALQDGKEIELPGFENNLYVEGNRK